MFIGSDQWKTRNNPVCPTSDVAEWNDLIDLPLDLSGPEGYPDRSASLNNLATALSTRFEQRGDGKNLDEAIQHHRIALQPRPERYSRCRHAPPIPVYSSLRSCAIR